jgi:hypothetical protein
MSSLLTPAESATASRDGWLASVQHHWMLAAVYAVLVAIALYPIFSVAVPPLVDYPNHLARMYILAHWKSIPELQQNYIADWNLHPNMAMELIVPFLARFMPIYMAGKLFIAATLLLLLGGTIALRRVVYGQVGLWPALTFLVLYNYVLFWGFLDYLFTAALALFAFSAWIALGHRGALFRLTAFSCITTILFVGHLFGLLVYGLLVLGYELWRVRGGLWFGRMMAISWGVSALQFAIPAVLFLQWMSANSADGEGPTVYGPLNQRLAALISPVHMGMPWVDIPAAVFLAILVVMCRSNKSVGFANELKLPLLLLVGAALAMPHQLAGVWGTHIRIPPLIACVAIAGVRLAPEARQFAVRAAYAAIAIFILRTAVVSHAWVDLNRKFVEFRAATAVIELGARTIVVEDKTDLPPGRIALYGTQFWHLAALAVIERAVFLPNLFTGHVGIDAAPAVQHLDTPNGIPLTRAILRESVHTQTSRFQLGHHFNRYMWAYWPGWPDHYDYVVSIRFDNRDNLDPDRLLRVGGGTFFDIYRVVKPSSVTSK